MRRILVGLLSLLVSAVFAQDDAYIAGIESNAMNRASAFTNDIRQINQAILASQKINQSMQDDIKSSINVNEPIATHLKKVSQVIVFLSFSMPEKSLKGWLLQCKQSGATPVIRGLINNSFKDTMVAVHLLSQKIGIGLQIDPILFKTFAITHVPAVVYVKDIPVCPANMNCLSATYDSIYGDVSLDYALEKMQNKADSANPTLDRMIHRLRGMRS